MAFGLFQYFSGSSTVSYHEGKKCLSKCGDQVKFDLGDHQANTYRYFKLDQLIDRARDRYQLDQFSWICSKGASEVEKKLPCKECAETFDARILVYLATRLRQLSLGMEDGKSRRFCATEAPASIPYDQFLRMIFGSHGCIYSICNSFYLKPGRYLHSRSF